MKHISQRPDWLNYAIEGGHLVIEGDNARVKQHIEGYQWREAAMPRRVWRLIAILAVHGHRGNYELPHVELSVEDDYVTILQQPPLVFAIEDFRDLAETFLRWDGSDTLPPVVLRAILNSLTDIGQIDAQDKRQLQQAIDSGLLRTYKGGPYQPAKTIYHYRMFA